MPAGRPQRVLLVCDSYPSSNGADGAREKVREWRALGAAVLVLAGNQQPPGTHPSGYVETEEVWVDGVTVYQVHFAPAIRWQRSGRHGAEASLKLVLEATLRQFRPDLVCVMLGPVFGAIPLRKAAEHGIAVEIVDSLSILGDVNATHRKHRLRRGRRPPSTHSPAYSQPDSSVPATWGKSRVRLKRMLRRVERR